MPSLFPNSKDLAGYEGCMNFIQASLSPFKSGNFLYFYILSIDDFGCL